MILFYYITDCINSLRSNEFQFHYDLILFTKNMSKIGKKLEFQFHYDLILFALYTTVLYLVIVFQFHYDLILLRML